MATSQTVKSDAAVKTAEKPAEKAVVRRQELAPALLGLAQRQHELAAMPKPAVIRRELAASFLANVPALALALDTMEAKLRGNKTVSDKVICALEAVKLCRHGLATVETATGTEQQYAMQVLRGHLATLAAWFTTSGSVSRNAGGEYKPSDDEKAFLRIAKSLMGQAVRLEPATLDATQRNAITEYRDAQAAKKAGTVVAGAVVESGK